MDQALGSIILIYSADEQTLLPPLTVYTAEISKLSPEHFRRRRAAEVIDFSKNGATRP